MFCEKCGAKLEEGDVFCSNCGHRQEETANVQPQPASADEKAEASIDPVLGKKIEYISSTGAAGFVEPDERPLYSLANGVMTHWVTGSGLIQDDAVLTNKRLYYSFHSGFINRVNVDEIVDLKDITGTKICNYNPIWLFLLSVVCFLVSFAALAMGEYAYIGIAGLILSIVLVCIYFMRKDTELSIEYPGGYIEFNVKYYGLAKIRAFQRCIYAAKELQNSEVSGGTQNVTVEENPPVDPAS